MSGAPHASPTSFLLTCQTSVEHPRIPFPCPFPLLMGLRFLLIFRQFLRLKIAFPSFSFYCHEASEVFFLFSKSLSFPWPKLPSPLPTNSASSTSRKAPPFPSFPPSKLPSDSPPHYLNPSPPYSLLPQIHPFPLFSPYKPRIPYLFPSPYPATYPYPYPPTYPHPPYPPHLLALNPQPFSQNRRRIPFLSICLHYSSFFPSILLSFLTPSSPFSVPPPPSSLSLILLLSSCPFSLPLHLHLIPLLSSFLPLLFFSVPPSSLLPPHPSSLFIPFLPPSLSPLPLLPPPPFPSPLPPPPFPLPIPPSPIPIPPPPLPIPPPSSPPPLPLHPIHPSLSLGESLFHLNARVESCNWKLRGNAVEGWAKRGKREKRRTDRKTERGIEREREGGGGWGREGRRGQATSRLFPKRKQRRLFELFPFPKFPKATSRYSIHTKPKPRAVYSPTSNHTKPKPRAVIHPLFPIPIQAKRAVIPNPPKAQARAVIPHPHASHSRYSPIHTKAKPRRYSPTNVTQSTRNPSHEPLFPNPHETPRRYSQSTRNPSHEPLFPNPHESQATCRYSPIHTKPTTSRYSPIHQRKPSHMPLFPSIRNLKYSIPRLMLSFEMQMR
ncbi:hypothetical protein C7M84_000528 [Penaeus vannamei]|uniref:Uncharacterized protein n=1 Tax=Penaeus vannamei TaxID=6689 RepID=A0A3R7QWF6_PENVA|nr:hypothetical protein C7M84_000528 [Penaeus vannamei]